MSVFISKITNPYVNSTLGSYLAKSAGSSVPEKLLFLSSSHHGVFIGKNQNCWKECDMQKMKADNIPFIRRDTGGGACYVDKGNRLFSFIEVNSNPEFKKYYPVIIKALNNLNLNAQMQGSNDIIVDGKKVSGSAFTFDGQVFKHHGTILHSVDKGKLSTYLTPSKIKLQSKGIDSVSARICNLVDINPNLTQDDLDREIIKSYQGREVVVLDSHNLSNFITNKSLYWNIFDQFTSADYKYNKNPDFTHKIEHRFSFGIVELLLSCSNNKIEKCEIFSDSLDLRFIDQLRKSFVFKDYSFQGIEEIQNELVSVLGDGYKDKSAEFCHYIRGEL